MPHYLFRFRQTPETWAKLIVNPEDRRAAISEVVESLGGKLHGYWYAFGSDDGYVLTEAPDNVTVAALSTLIASTGALELETTVLISVEEMLEALAKAKALQYRPPGD